MDIYLLRDGKEFGPYSEETTQSFLQQGAILIDDLAWTPGLPAWSPLVQVLYPATEPEPVEQDAVEPEIVESLIVEEEPAALEFVESASIEDEPAAPEFVESVIAEPAPASEPATPKQKAFLTYIGIAFSNETRKECAALLVTEAMENPALNARVLQWNDARLTLHPDLFAAEARAKKEGRANRYFDSCQREGADRVEGVTKAHCQVLIGYLDVNFPNWDAHEADAARTYFFPAVAEKFPELVQKAWRGKLKFPGGPKVAPEIVAQSRVVRARTRPSPIAAAVRGIVFGLALLLALYIAKEMFSGDPADIAPAAVVPMPGR